MTTTNQAQIDVRGVKQAIWKREWIAVTASASSTLPNTTKFQLLEEQHRSEPHHQETACAGQEACHGDRTPSLDTADTGGAGTSAASFSDLELNYKSRRDAYRARAYFAESFLNGPELVQLALSILNFDFEGEEKRWLPI